VLAKVNLLQAPQSRLPGKASSTRPVRAIPGTCLRRMSARERQSESASQRAPTCDCQGEVATSGQVGATPQVATPNCDPNGATCESRARAASGRRTAPPPQGPIGATPRMRGPNEGPPRNGALERVSGACPSESANQRAPTCDCQGEVATPQVATQMGPPARVARGSPPAARWGRCP
jgi:hypothetical protein